MSARQRTAGTDEAMLQVLAARRHPPRPHHLRWLALGERLEPQPGRIGVYEPARADRDDIGICCSGGGIRSAAFNLGALQSLQAADARTLQRAKYVSAVSGGSYIAAAFCMVAKTWDAEEFPAGERPPADHAGADDSDPRLVTDAKPPFHPGSPEEQYLRNHLGYLAPDGLARVYLALRMFAGLAVNTLLLALPVLVVGLLAGWLARAHYGQMAVGRPCAPHCHYSAQLPPWVVAGVVVLAGLAALFALADVTWRARYDWLRVLVATWEVRLFLFAAAWALALMLVPWLAAKLLAYNSGHHSAAVPSVGTALGSILSLCAAAVGHVRGRIRDARKELADATSRLGRFAKPVREALIALVVSLAGPLLLLSVAVFGVLVAVLTSPAGAAAPVALPLVGHVTSAFAIWLGASAALLAAMYFLVDLNSVSLHPFYRRRLATAFALKRVWVRQDGALAAYKEGAEGTDEARRRDFDRLVELSKSAVEPGSCALEDWPMLVVCTAANVSDPGATPPGRAVASFTFSPKAIGGPLTGAVETLLYETTFGRNRRRDITLLAAVAMSGAALSPAMGKLTYRPLMFLLAMANIRLGVWVPNPLYLVEGEQREKHLERMTPTRLPRSRKPPADRISIVHRPRARYLWKEVTGRNRLEDRFLYVTDGGHYENLGLVELLRRGCRRIYCFDAGGGANENALGDAIALARSELGVDIRMRPEIADLAEDPATGRAKRTCARGRIVFPPDEHGAQVEGTLFYARSVLAKGARWELANYQAADPVFPHHSTFDQFFDDQKFEAYRLLGADAAAAALKLPALHRAPAPVAVAGNGAGALPLAPGPVG